MEGCPFSTRWSKLKYTMRVRIKRIKGVAHLMNRENRFMKMEAYDETNYFRINVGCVAGEFVTRSCRRTQGY